APLAASAAPPGARPEAPGMLSSHYAPRARLRLRAAGPEPGEAWLAFAAPPLAGRPSETLSEQGDLREAAARLFAALRRLDREAEAIAVAEIPERGLGRAINDRLRRAAAPR
ncbi:MAG: Sua5 family C-terminal domain-containing protein, partial [Pseudomonadota bacterium]